MCADKSAARVYLWGSIDTEASGGACFAGSGGHFQRHRDSKLHAKHPGQERVSKKDLGQTSHICPGSCEIAIQPLFETKDDSGCKRDLPGSYPWKLSLLSCQTELTNLCSCVR